MVFIPLLMVVKLVEFVIDSVVDSSFSDTTTVASRKKTNKQSQLMRRNENEFVFYIAHCSIRACRDSR